VWVIVGVSVEVGVKVLVGAGASEGVFVGLSVLVGICVKVGESEAVGVLVHNAAMDVIVVMGMTTCCPGNRAQADIKIRRTINNPFRFIAFFSVNTEEKG